MSKKRPDLEDTNNNPGLVDLGYIPNQAPVANFNIDGVENLIQTKGFIGFHYRHAYNPDRETQNGPASPNTQASFRGLRYYNPRPLYQVPQSFKIEDRLTAQAIYSKGSVIMNISGKYADDVPDQTSQTHLRQRDLLIFPSLTDMNRQQFEYNPTGPQKLHYKVKGVDLLFDDERDYVCDRDFRVNSDGHIEWLDGGAKPDFKKGKGAVLSIVYYYTPIYIVSGLLHSLRVIPSNPQGHAAYPRDATYAPQQIVCTPSNLVEESDLEDWSALPPLPEWPASKNTTGGSV